MPVKICTRCKTEKDILLFCKHSNCCKSCKSRIDETYRANNKEKIAAMKKRYHDNNRGKIREYQRVYQRAYKKGHPSKKSPKARVRHCLGSRVREAIKGKYITEKTKRLLGCDLGFLMQYLESKFKPGMTWQNHGAWRVGQPMTWHIDHIKPCALFDLIHEEEQLKCFHYSNLQPLWAQENLSKKHTFVEMG